MAVTVTSFDEFEHTITVSLGITPNQELVIHHVSDLQIQALKTGFAGLSGATDPTPQLDVQSN